MAVAVILRRCRLSGEEYRDYAEADYAREIHGLGTPFWGLITLATCHKPGISNMIAIMSNALSDGLSKLESRTRKLSAGQVLFRVGDPVLSLFLVSTGEMRLTRTLPNGYLLTLQRAAPGAILAEASIFADSYHCDASAAEDSVLRVIPQQRIRAALRDDADLSSALTRDLAQKVHRARTHAEILSLKTVAERVDAWMTLHDGSLPPKGRWRQIASEIGVAPEALYRELALRR